MLSRVRTRFNVEFDSRILRVSIGAAGVTRPRLLSNGLEKVYCAHCGKPSGAITADLPLAARHDPAPLIICDACHEANKGIPGFLPNEAIGFGHRR
jgi:hypothetical protein